MTTLQMEQIVSEHLKGLPFEVEVVPGSIRKEGDWWNVAVQARQEPARQWRYYEILADIETEIEDEHHEKVMLVPVTWSEPAERPV